MEYNIIDHMVNGEQYNWIDRSHTDCIINLKASRMRRNKGL
ncbi:MAG: hypothetical protein K0R84_471 [Clostridia bacterium]|jgi:hypothetical protein|nr:hypothetical protein [Clostridia bacterium]